MRGVTIFLMAILIAAVFHVRGIEAAKKSKAVKPDDDGIQSRLLLASLIKKKVIASTAIKLLIGVPFVLSLFGGGEETILYYYYVDEFGNPL